MTAPPPPSLPFSQKSTLGQRHEEKHAGPGALPRRWAGRGCGWPPSRRAPRDGCGNILSPRDEQRRPGSRVGLRPRVRRPLPPQPCGWLLTLHSLHPVSSCPILHQHVTYPGSCVVWGPLTFRALVSKESVCARACVRREREDRRKCLKGAHRSGVHTRSLYYYCNFSASLTFFKVKKLSKKIYPTKRNHILTYVIVPFPD